MRRLPPLNALRAFEATARLSSITAAAQELGVTHSAVSQHVKQLEEYLGQKLFTRPGKRVAPTPAAEALLRDVGAAFDSIAAASERLTRRGIRRIVTVNASTSFAMRWLLPRIAAFQKQNKGLELRLETATSGARSQLDPNCDVTIKREPVARPGYICRPFLDDCAAPVLLPRLAQRHDLKGAADLMSFPLLHTRSDPDAWRRWFNAQGVATPHTLDGPFFDTTAMSLQAASLGLGVALAPLAFVNDDLAQGLLTSPFPDLVVRGPGFHLHCTEASAHERGVRELLRWLTREGAQTSGLAGDSRART